MGGNGCRLGWSGTAGRVEWWGWGGRLAVVGGGSSEAVAWRRKHGGNRREGAARPYHARVAVHSYIAQMGCSGRPMLRYRYSVAGITCGMPGVLTVSA